MGAARQSSSAPRSAKAFAEAHAFLDSLVENIPNMVFVKSAHDLRFVRFNRAGEELLGISRSELVGRSDYDFFPKEQADAFTARDHDVLRNGHVVDIPEERILTKHQGERILHTKKIPLLGKTGEPEYLLGISEDITDRVQAEERRMRILREEAALREREAAAGRVTFLASASGALATSLKIEEALNALARIAAQSICDWCVATLVGKDGTLSRVAAVHQRPELQSALNEFLARLPPQPNTQVSSAAVVQTGQSVFLPSVPEEAKMRATVDQAHQALLEKIGSDSFLLVPIEARGKIFGTLSFSSSGHRAPFNDQDLYLAQELGRRAGTAAENASLYETAQRAVSARDEFISVASHELKTPLTSLLLQLQLLQRAIHKGETLTSERNLSLALEQARRLGSLVEELLDITSLQANRLDYQFGEHDICEVARRCVESLRQQFQQQGSDIQVEAPANVPMVCDPKRLERVITNLLTNALKYGGGRPVQLKIEGQPESVSISVCDQGIGIEPEKLEVIFQRFERASSHSSASGLGLGLYIAKQIVQAHQGEIRVSSRPREGSTFTVALPRRPGRAQSGLQLH